MKKKSVESLLLIGSSGDASDVRYASGFTPLDPIVFLQRGAKRYLVVPALEVGRAKQTAHGVEVLMPQELPITSRDRKRLSGWALGALRHAGVKRATVSPFFPLGIADRLRKSGVALRVSRKPLYPRRAVKQTGEIRAIREAQQAAVAAVRGAIAMIRAASIDRRGYLRAAGRPLTSEAVRRAIELSLWQRDMHAPETIVAGGEQSADPHERGHGPLRAGQPIVIDVFPQSRVSGYWGDITRTVVKGGASPELKRMYGAVKAAQEAALRRVRAGVHGSTVDREARTVFSRRGFKTRVEDGRAEGFFHSTGHGVGLDIHESPSVSVQGGRLRAGEVITIEPGLYYPDVGGIRIEDTVVVTKQGWRYLARCEKRFEV